MGIVYVRDGKAFVYEAVQPVRMTPLARWVKRGVGGRYVARRLKDADRRLTPDALRKMLEAGKTFEGRPYDLAFEWSDDRLYCSELVWKIYDRALGIKLGALQKMKDFDLSAPVVQAKVKERWGGKPPLDEPVISPAGIFDSPLLVTAHEGEDP